MARASFQVLVLPYKISSSGEIEYAVFLRSDGNLWQGISGGGEDDEVPIEAAIRECMEEAKIPGHLSFIQLDNINSIPLSNFKDSDLWGKDVYIIPEYSFGVDIGDHKIELSSEHKKYQWVTYAEALILLEFDSNKTALWELNQRILGGDIRKESGKI
jgi:dATP pyrophosphohydrolase